MKGTTSAFVTVCCLAILGTAHGWAQSPCPTSVVSSTAVRSSDLICLVPQVYGPGGLVGNDNGGPLNATSGHEVHFQASALSNFGPVNTELGVELSQLPIAAPVAGFVFEGGVLTPEESYGPVLTERAETLGRHKVFVGASYQYFNFDAVDGTSLRNFGVVLTHEAEPTVCSSQSTIPCIATPDGPEPVYTQDIIATQNRVDLKVHQMSFVATFGLGENLDFSVAVPVLDVRMGMQSTATIFNFEPQPVNHSFAPITSNEYETYLDPYDALFRNHTAVLGISDMTLRVKYRAWRAGNEKTALATGVDVRVPSGDANRFLGSGTWGVRPFLTYTTSGRFSPHATVGMQINGKSVLAGDVTTQPVTKAKLPDIFSYSGGADVYAIRHLSLSVDFIGSSLLSAPRIVKSTFTDYAGGTHANITATTATVNEAGIAAGGKIRLGGKLLFTGNVLVRVNQAGLHSKPAPLAGLSYTF